LLRYTKWYTAPVGWPGEIRHEFAQFAESISACSRTVTVFLLLVWRVAIFPQDAFHKNAEVGANILTNRPINRCVPANRLAEVPQIRLGVCLFARLQDDSLLEQTTGIGFSAKRV
jgi:hypothetical protein